MRREGHTPLVLRHRETNKEMKMDPYFRGVARCLIAGVTNFPIDWRQRGNEEVRTYTCTLLTYHYVRYVSTRFRNLD